MYAQRAPHFAVAPTHARRFAAPLLVVLLALLVALGGCRTTRDREVAQAAPEVLYNRAWTALQAGNYDNATRLYEALEARFPFSNETRQSRLDLMYAYYRRGDREQAIEAADTFIRENPTHPRIDYAWYIKGLVNFERSRNFLERWFAVDLTDRPPQELRQSIDAFARVLQQFPNSEYAPDSRQRMIYLRNQLAQYEVNVARWYVRRGAHVAAVNRARYAIENYDGAPATRDALEIMIQSYQALGLDDLARSSAQVLAANFPERIEVLERRRWWRFW